MVLGGGGTIIRQAKKVEDLPVHCAVKLEIVIVGIYSALSGLDVSPVFLSTVSVCQLSCSRSR